MKAVRITEKSNMKTGQNFEPSVTEKFECRLLENSTTNSQRYPASKSDYNNSSYGI